MMWKWRNVPIPVQHLLGLLVGGVLQFLFKQRFLPWPWIGHALGWPLVAMGIGLAVWAVVEAGDTDVEAPSTLLTAGPYSLSRNPMYVAWTLFSLGIALAANSPWILALLPLAAAFTHLVDIRTEERLLDEEFGDEYQQYRARVRRYL